MINSMMITTIVILGLTSLIAVDQIDGAQIISFNVTSPVENGTSSVILDCNFIFDPSEENLVMKWYFNDNPRPVYQWIIALKKRSYSEEIRRHIDPDFTINNQQTDHRAIRLIKPTTKLSGTYKCIVSSIQNTDSASAKLIVYAPAKSFNFKAHNESTVLCKATGLYPSPVIDLYRLVDTTNSNNNHHHDVINQPGSTMNDDHVNYHVNHHSSSSSMTNKMLTNSNHSNRVKITSEGYTVTTGEAGKFSIESIGSIGRSSSTDHHMLPDEQGNNDVNYESGSISYQCVISIPDTNYSLTKTLTLTKGWNQQQSRITGKSLASCINNQSNTIIFTLISISLCLLLINN